MKETKLILSLCREMGWNVKDQEAAIDRFQGKHHWADIRDAANGNVVALLMLRADCGLKL